MIYIAHTTLDPTRRHIGSRLIPGGDPEPYRARLVHMKSDRARLHTRVGLWLLAQTLDAAGYHESRVAKIAIDDEGRPTITQGPAFSISHSDGVVICALSDQVAIGIDVERRRPLDIARMRRLNTPAEQARIEADPPSFFDLWCAREAVVKASGRVGLRRIRRVAIDQETGWLDGRCWHLRALSLIRGYAACLACDRPIRSITYRDFSRRFSENTAR